MRRLNCEICQRLTNKVTVDEEHVICSRECLLALNSLLRMNAFGFKTPEKEMERTLLAHGKGQVKVTPDRVRVTVVIVVQTETTTQVNQALVENSDALLGLLKDQVEKLQTLELTLTPIREKPKEGDDVYYNQQHGKIIGYEGRFPISFETPVANAGKMIDLALKDNHANVLENVEYIVSEPIAKSAYNDALRLATQDAESKADIVLKTLGLTKRGIQQIAIEESRYASSISYETGAKSFAAKSAIPMVQKNTQLIAGETEIEANVTLTLVYQ